jgi:hypothetical protein
MMSPYWICWIIGTVLIALSWFEIIPSAAGWTGFGMALGAAGLSAIPNTFGIWNADTGGAKMYEAQWEEHERQQKVAQRQLEESDRQQEIAQRQLEQSQRQQKESQHQFEMSRQQLEEKQRQLDASSKVLALENENARKIAQLVETYADLAKRLNAVLSEWEQKGNP